MTLYQEIRAAGKEMQAKALDATKHLDFNPLRIAKQMTLPLNGRTLIFDGEAAQNAFFDFWFHEYRVNGKSLIESVDPVTAGFSPLETEILAAHCRSSTSYFEMEAVLPETRQIRLRDLLNPSAPSVLLTDYGLSESAARFGARLALFCRLVEVRAVTMTSGFTFGFQPDRSPGILQAYRQKMKKVPASELPPTRFAFFFRKYRQFGEKQDFRDAV